MKLVLVSHQKAYKELHFTLCNCNHNLRAFTSSFMGVLVRHKLHIYGKKYNLCSTTLV